MKMFRNDCLLSIIAGICLVFLWALPVMAQEGKQQQGQPGVTESQPKISDGELEKTVEAYGEIVVIHDRFQESVQQTEDLQQKRRLQEEANRMMVQAVQNAGLDVETYKKIMAAVRTDENVAYRFKEKMQQ